MATITGTPSNNVLNGTAQSDELYGLDGDDTLNGGGGADRLVGGLGADTLTGGAAADTFVYNSAAESTAASRDVITDFTTADRIDLTTLAAGALVWSATTPRAWGVWYTQSGGNTFVSADTDGDGVEDFSLQLTGTIALAATHFIGINQAPDLRSTSGDTIARTVTETNAGLTTTGTLTVTDPDAIQTVSVAVVGTSFSGTPEAVAAVQAAASGWMSVTAGALPADAADRNNVAWTFDSGSEAFNFLKNGQSLQITYLIQATDSNTPGTGKDTQAVTITISGKNDGPQIVAGAGDSAGATVTEGAASLVASGTLGVIDPDQFDTFTGSVYAVATSGPTGGLSATTLRGYLTVGITPGATNPQSTASLGWTFNPGAQAFDFLGEGETLTLSYTVRATDSAGAIGSSVVTIEVQGQNDAAVLTGSATRAYTENAAAVSIYNNGTLTLTDIDDTIFPSAQVSITGNFRAGQDVLSFSNTSATTYGDIQASYDAANGVLDLVSASGTATRAQWQSALRNVRYANSSDAPDTATRTISFQINDGGSVNGQSSIATSTVTITATNDAPQILADAGDVASAGVQEGASGLTTSGTLSIVDPDQLDSFTGSVYAVSTTGPTGGISATTLRSFLTVAVTPETTSPQTTASLGWTFDSGSQAFNHLAEGQTLTLNYTVRATDAAGTYGSHLVTIVIQGQNDAPVLAGTATRVYTENGAAITAHTTALTLTDIDDTTFVSAQVSITGGFQSAQDVLSFTNTSATTYGNIQAIYDAGTGVLSLVSEGGTATLGQWQAALRNVRYANSSDSPDTTARTISFQIDDGGSVNGQSNIATSTVTITATNDAPQIVVGSGNSTGATIQEGTTGLISSGTLGLVDPDALDTVTPTVVSVVASGTLGGLSNATLKAFMSAAVQPGAAGSPTTGTLTWNFNSGAQSFQFLGEGETLTLNYTLRVADAAGTNSGTRVVTVVIQGENDAPVLTTSTAISYTENAAPVVINNGVTLADVDDVNFAVATVSITGNFRAGQDALSFTGTAATGNISGTYNAATGVMTLVSADGTATATQWRNSMRAVRYANSSDAPDTAARTVSFQVNDGSLLNGQSNIVTSTVTINAVNDAPLTAPVALAPLRTGGGTRLITQADLLVNATDVDGPSLTALALQISTGLGTLVANGNGTWTYTPAVADTSQVSFTYSVSDGTLSAAATASLDLVPNTAPVATNASTSIAEDTLLSGALPAATDADGDALTYSLETGASNGTAVVNADGTYTYTPTGDYNGGDSFTYRVSDAYGGTSTATITITVTPVNDAPVAAATSATTNEDTVLNGTLPAATDVDGNAVTYGLEADATNGSVIVNGDGTYTYTPDADFNGNDSFSYTIDDGHGGTSTYPVAVTVTPMNDAPVAGATASVTLNAGAAFSVAVPASLITDVDGDALSYGAAPEGGGSLPAWLSFNTATGHFTGTPPAGAADVVVRVTATDPSLASASQLITFAVNDAPTQDGTGETPASPVGILRAFSGVVVTPVGSGADQAFGLLVQPDGRVLTVGYTSVLSGTTDQNLALARYNADGSLDSSFGTGGTITLPLGTGGTAPADVGRAVALQSDGRIVVAGFATFAATGSDLVLLRYNADGTPDASFGTEGRVIRSIGTGVSNDAVNGLVIQPDGRILASGYAVVDGATSNDFLVVRYLADGTPDTTFGNNGVVTTGIATGGGQDVSQSLALMADGRIVVAGWTYSNGTGGNGANDFALTRYNSNGTLDTTFSNDGIATFSISGLTGSNASEQGRSVQVLADGKILVGGWTTGSGQDFALLRFNADGTLDTTFNSPLGYVSTSIGPAGLADNAQSVLVQPDGSIVLVGFANMGAGSTGQDIALVRYTANGALDTTFSGDGIATLAIGPGNTPEQGFGAALLPDGGIVVAGFTGTAFTSNTVLARFNASGSTNNSFSTNIVVSQGATFGFSIPEGWFGDPEGGPLTYSVARTDGGAPPAWVNFDPETNRFSGTPGPGDTDAVLRLTATDSGGLSVSQLLTIRLNEAPALGVINLVTNEDTVANATAIIIDQDGDALTSFVVATQATHGTATFASSGAYTYTPFANYSGADSFVLRVTDAFGASTDSTVNVTVNPVNDAPIAGVAANVTLNAATAFDVAVPTGLITDVDGNALTYSAALEGGGTLPSWLTFNTSTGHFTGTPPAGAADVIVRVTGTDPSLASASQLITFAINDAPYLSDSDEDPAEENVGILDGDGIEGVVVTSLGAGSDQGYEVVVQPDGKLLVIGQTTTDRGLDVALLRYYSTGQLDTTFGTGGKVVLPIDPGTGADVGRGIALQSDGRIVVVGLTTGAGGSDVALLRFNTNGSLDTSFGGGDGIVTQPIGLADDGGVAVSVLSDGKIVVSGYSASTATGQDFALLRFTTNGSLDNTFGSGTGMVVTPINPGAGNEAVFASVFQSDGKIVAVGTTTSADGTTSDMALVRYNPNGTLDSSFGGGDGIVIQSMSSLAGPFAEASRAVAVLPDGKILVGGWIASSGTGGDLALVRFNADGSLDTSFGVGGAVTTAVWNPPVSRLDWAFDMAVQPDGRIVVTGITDRGSATGVDIVLARYTATGALDVGNFGNNGDSGINVTEIGRGTVADVAFGVTLHPDGGILVVGWTGPAGNEDIMLLRFDSEGEEDEGFNASVTINRNADFGLSLPPGMFVDPEGGQVSYSVTQLNGDPLPAWLHFNTGTLRIYGHPGVGDTDVALRLIATDPEGASTYFPFTLRVNDAPVAAAVTLSTTEDTPLAGNLPPGVDFWSDDIDYSLDTPAAHGIVRVNENGTYTYTPANNFYGTDSFVYRVTDFVDEEGDDEGDYVEGLSNTYTVTVNVTAVEDAPFFQDPNHENWESSPSIGILDGDGGAVTTALGQALNADAANYAVLQADGKILVVGNATVNVPGGTDLNMALVRYNPNGTLDTSFGIGGQVVLQIAPAVGLADNAQGVVVLPDGKILVAGTAFVSGTAASPVNRDLMLIRLTENGSLDSTFGNGGKAVTPVVPGTNDDGAFSLLVRPDGRIVVAGFTTGSGQDFLLVGYNADGKTVDSSFGTNGIVTTSIAPVNDTINRAVLLSDGSILVVGTTVPAAGANGDIVLARYAANGALDPNFGTNGPGITITSLNSALPGTIEAGRQLAVLGDGKILVGGYTTTADGADFVLLRYTDDGVLDTSFGGGHGYVIQTLTSGFQNDLVNDMTVLPDGRILLAGYSAANGTDFAMIRFTENGVLDTTFGENHNGMVTESIGQSTALDQASRVLVQADGRILLVGTSFTQTGGNDFALLRFSADGYRDVTFGTTLVVNNNTNIQFSIPAYMVVDPEGDAMTFTATLANGSPLSTVGLSFDAVTRQFSGTVSSASDVQIRLTATESHGLSTTMPITLHVNHAPAVANATISTTENNLVTSPLPVDTDRDVQAYTITAGPSHGGVVFTSAVGAVLTYTPAPNYSGSDSFTYTATDYYGSSSTNTVTVSVGGTTTFSDLLFESTFQGASNADTRLPANESIGVLHATGSLGDQAVTWTLVSGPGFQIAANGTVSVGAMQPNSTYTFTARATGTGPLGGIREETFDVITGNANNEANLPTGGPGAAILGGDDFLMGISGNDTISGGPGNDILMGQAGNDVLSGNSGHDWLHGGTGGDRFVFLDGSGSDIIADFEHVADKIDLSGITNPNWTNFSEVVAHTTYDAGGALINLGNGSTIYLVGVTSLVAADFLL